MELLSETVPDPRISRHHIGALVEATIALCFSKATGRMAEKPRRQRAGQFSGEHDDRYH